MRHLFLLFVTTASLSFILLNSRQPCGDKYYTVMTSEDNTKNPGPQEWPLRVRKIGKYFTNPLQTANYVFGIHDKVTIKGILLCADIAILICAGIRLLLSKKENIKFVLWNMSLFFLTLFLLSTNRRVWAMHHVVLSLPFLLLSLFFIYSKLRSSRIIIFLFCACIAINWSLYYDLKGLTPGECNFPSNQKLNNLLNSRFGDRYVFVVIDWGMYYLKALYGRKNQCVLYMAPLSNWQINELKKILAGTKRKAVFIGRVDSVSGFHLINEAFPGLEVLKTDFDTGKWQVAYEK